MHRALFIELQVENIVARRTWGRTMGRRSRGQREGLHRSTRASIITGPWPPRQLNRRRTISSACFTLRSIRISGWPAKERSYAVT